jgi:tRNA pseudouridine55 synthase
MSAPPVEGVLIIDKPAGITSHDVVNWVRRVSGLRRVGHAGTLDPLATGVLLLCLGRATRLVEYLVGQPKTYETAVRLGQITDTYDADGVVVAERPIPPLSAADIEGALARFRGSIQQVVPLYAAIKQGGQPLYRLARQGLDVTPPVREVTIYELTLLEWASPLLRLRVVCSAGAYIRSLAHDLGERLGCGGHVQALRRTAVGRFTVDAAVPLADLTTENLPAHLLPSDTAVVHLPRLDLSTLAATRLQQGQPVERDDAQPDASLVRVYNAAGHFIGVATARDTTWQAHKIFLPTAD